MDLFRAEEMKRMYVTQLLVQHRNPSQAAAEMLWHVELQSIKSNQINRWAESVRLLRYDRIEAGFGLVPADCR